MKEATSIDNKLDMEVNKFLETQMSAPVYMWSNEFESLYIELCKIAHLRLKRERYGHTLNTEGLVHEAFLKLTELERIKIQDRNHFFSIASTMMRQILMNYARSRNAKKRKGNAEHIRFSDELDGVVDLPWDYYECLDEALMLLKELDERAHQVVMYHFFIGLKFEEIAESLNMTVRTVFRDWKMARTFLERKLKKCRES